MQRTFADLSRMDEEQRPFPETFCAFCKFATREQPPLNTINLSHKYVLSLQGLSISTRVIANCNLLQGAIGNPPRPMCISCREPLEMPPIFWGKCPHCIRAATEVWNPGMQVVLHTAPEAMTVPTLPLQPLPCLKGKPNSVHPKDRSGAAKARVCHSGQVAGGWHALACTSARNPLMCVCVCVCACVKPGAHFELTFLQARIIRPVLHLDAHGCI